MKKNLKAIYLLVITAMLLGTVAPVSAASAPVEQDADGLSTATGVYILNGEVDTQSGQSYIASNTDQSGVYVLNGGNLTLNNATPQPQTVDAEIQAKIAALTEQIRVALTSQQIQAIADMKITQEMATSIMQEQGITLGGSQQNGKDGNNQHPQGTPPVGGASDGDGQPPVDGQKSGNGQMATPPVGGVPGGAGFMPTELVDALIKLLQSKAG